LHRYESSDDELDDDTSSTVLDETGQLLYDGSLLTVAASCVLIKKFALRHDLTKVAIGDLLQLIRMHCPQPNHCPTSVYRFNKQLGDLEQPSKETLLLTPSIVYKNLMVNEVSRTVQTGCVKRTLAL